MPRWSHRGDEIFYMDLRSNLVAVRVTPRPPFAVENNADDDKESRRKKEAEELESRAKKAEAFGILAVEPASEKEPELSPLEKAWAATRRPESEAEEEPAAEEAPAEEPVAVAAAPAEETTDGE